MKLTPPQEALLGYMEGQSEARWAAGWLSHLDEALQGDPAYDWLVEQAGGTWHYSPELLPPEERVNGRDLVWVRHVHGGSPSKVMPKLKGHVPTKTPLMREAIILGLAHLEQTYPGDGFLSNHIQFVLEDMYENAFHGMDWDMRGPFAKAFDRAMDQLRAEGIIIREDANLIENRLFIYAESSDDDSGE